MTIYNFYARPIDTNDDSLIIVTPNPNILSLKYICIINNKYDTYEIVDKPLTEDVLVVEEHHYYRILRMGWTHNSKESWYHEDTIPFNILINPSNFIKVIKQFYKKPFRHGTLVNIIHNDNVFRQVCEDMLGNDIDYIDMYFDRNENWSLTKLEIKEIRTITYKNSYED